MRGTQARATTGALPRLGCTPKYCLDGPLVANGRCPPPRRRLWRIQTAHEPAHSGCALLLQHLHLIGQTVSARDFSSSNLISVLRLTPRTPWYGRSHSSVSDCARTTPAAPVAAAPRRWVGPRVDEAPAWHRASCSHATGSAAGRSCARAALGAAPRAASPVPAAANSAQHCYAAAAAAAERASGGGLAQGPRRPGPRRVAPAEQPCGGLSP